MHLVRSENGQEPTTAFAVHTPDIATVPSSERLPEKHRKKKQPRVLPSTKELLIVEVHWNIVGLYTNRLSFSRCGVGPKHLHFSRLPVDVDAASAHPTLSS